MTRHRAHTGRLLLLAWLSVACAGGDADDDREPGTAGAGGQSPAAAAGRGGGGANGAGVGSSGSGGTDSSGAGASPTAGNGGDAPVDGAVDRQVRDTSDTCLYSAVRLQIERGDGAVEASTDSWIKTAVYDRSGDTTFTIDTHDGDHLELSWQPPASKPAVVDFRARLSYAAQSGSRRALCLEGRMLDAFNYPIELYFPFVATAAFEATSDGTCTDTLIPFAVSGCVSEGYNLR